MTHRNDFALELANVIAGTISDRIGNKRIDRGERVVVSGFSKTVLLSAANQLAHWAEQETDQTDLIREHVLFVCAETEAVRLPELQAANASHQTCSSYCVNIRDRGATAIFFVPRDVEAFIDESLGTKGSVRLSRFKGASSLALHRKALLKVLSGRGYSADSLESALDMVLDRVGTLLGNDYEEMVAYKLIDRFLNLEIVEDPKASHSHSKSLCLVPFGDNLASSIADNLAEIDRLREQTSNPKTRRSYEERHIAHDSVLWSLLENHLRKYQGRVPTESDIDEFCSFFDDWPSQCDSSFLRCAAANATGRITLLLHETNSDMELRRIPGMAVHILCAPTVDLKWRLTSNLAEHRGLILINGNETSEVELRARSIDIRTDQLQLPIGEVSTIAITPAPQCEVRLATGAENIRSLIRFSEDSFQILCIIAGRHLVWASENDMSSPKEVDVVSDVEHTLAARLYNGCDEERERPEIFVNDEATNRLLVGSGEEACVRIVYSNSVSLELQIVATGLATGELDIGGRPKKQSLLSALTTARQAADLRDAVTPLELGHVIKWPWVRIMCQGLLDWNQEFEAVEGWASTLLDQLLLEPGRYMPRSVVIKRDTALISDVPLDTRDGAPWPTEHSLLPDSSFMRARKSLFEKIVRIRTSEGMSLPFISLVELRDSIYEYVSEYQHLLDQALARGRYSREDALLSLIDTFLLISSENPVENGQINDVELRSGVYLMAPTHPVRLAWLLRREEFMINLIEQSAPISSRLASEVLDGAGYPELLCLPDGTVLRHSKSELDAFFALYQIEILDSGKTLTALQKATMQLGHQSPDLNPMLPDARKLASAMSYVHRLLPYRKDLKVMYENPGEANSLVEASRLTPERGEGGTGLHRRLFAKDSLALHFTLVQEEPALTAGRAFRLSARNSEGRARSTFPERVEIQIPFTETDIQSKTSDLGFPDDTVSRTVGNSLTLERCPKTNPICGLFAPIIRRSHYGPDGTGTVLLSRVHPIPSEGDPDKLSELCHRYQTVFTNPTEGQAFDAGSCRAYGFECNRAFLDRIRKYQGLSTFLFTMDTGPQLEVFDRLALRGENVIIDFDPIYNNPIARSLRAGRGGESSRREGHNFIITTRRSSIVQARLRAVLTGLLGCDPDDEILQSYTETVFRTLNGVSGRYLREVLQGISDIKEAVACALTCRLVEELFVRRISSLEENRRGMMTIIIPLDDHWGHIYQLASGSDPTLRDNRHADLLFLTIVNDPEDECLHLWPRFAEVKYRTDGSIPTDARVQIANSWRVFLRWLGLRPVSVRSEECYCEFGFDSTCMEELRIRLADLAFVAGVYMPRTARFFPNLVPKEMKIDGGTEETENSMLTKIYTAKCRIFFDLLPHSLTDTDRIEEGQDVVVGNVFIWGPLEKNAATREVREQGRPVVKVGVFGRAEARELLGGIE